MTGRACYCPLLTTAASSSISRLDRVGVGATCFASIQPIVQGLDTLSAGLGHRRLHVLLLRVVTEAYVQLPILPAAGA